MGLAQPLKRKALGVWAAHSSLRSGVERMTCCPSTRLIVSVTGVAAITASPACTRGTAADQLRFHQAAGSVVDEHGACSGGQGRQPAAHRFLACVAPFDPAHGAISCAAAIIASTSA